MRRRHSPRLTRRDLLVTGASLTGIALTARTAQAATRSGPAQSNQFGEAEALLDVGLERIAARFPDVNLHRSNHAAMVIEVLALTGFASHIEGWLDENLARFQPNEAAPKPIEGDDWRAALSQPARSGDWHARMQLEIERDGYAATLERWIPRLAPGLSGAATHGVIRTAHAARSLGRRDTPARRNELAIALTYWACVYRELPWDGTLAPEASVADALARVTPRRPTLPPPGGSIAAGLVSLDDTPEFAPVAGFVDVSDPLVTLSQITTTFARQYVRDPEKRIHFTHAVTAPSALRLLLPYMNEETTAAGVRFAWQAAAALYAVYVDPTKKDREVRPGNEAEIMKLAAGRGRTHGIKLSEACLRELAHRDDPILLAAAWDAAVAMDA